MILLAGPLYVLRMSGEWVGKRPYRMQARAAAAAATSERILDAAELTFLERPNDEITLAAVAESSGVSVQTVLRKFGNREGLMTAALARVAARVSLQRGSAPIGDPPAAIAILVDHYEELGDRVVHLLAEARRSKAIRKLTRMGFAYHREWCKQVFAPALDRLEGEELELRTAQLVAATDVYVWKLLRREQGLSREQTERAMVGLVAPLAGAEGAGGPG